MSVDPLAHLYPSVSPYVYSLNDPIGKRDPDGRFVWGAVIGAAVDFGLQVGSSMAQGQSFSSAVSNVDYGSVTISAGAGLLSGGLSVATKTMKVAKTVNTIGNAAIAAGESMAKSAAQGKDITFSGVVTDVAVGTVAGAVKDAGKAVAQNSAAAKQLTKKAKTLTNIANTGRPRASQTARAAQAQTAAQNYGGGTVSQTVTGVSAGVVGTATKSNMQGTTAVPNNSVSNQSGVANSDNTTTVINEEQLR